MITVATYTPEEIFNAIRNDSNLPDGKEFKKNSHRLQLFYTKGTQCVNCDTQGATFILETQNPNIRPHLNLYAITSTGKKILMTKDHIHPKSKGGANELENYNPMCYPCNSKKGNNI